MIPKKPLTANVIDSINCVLEYNWDDELDDYQVQYLENGEVPESHIFHALIDIKNWLEGTTLKPEDFLDED